MRLPAQGMAVRCCSRLRLRSASSGSAVPRAPTTAVGQAVGTEEVDPVQRSPIGDCVRLHLGRALLLGQAAPARELVGRSTLADGGLGSAALCESSRQDLCPLFVGGPFVGRAGRVRGGRRPCPPSRAAPTIPLPHSVPVPPPRKAARPAHWPPPPEPPPAAEARVPRRRCSACSRSAGPSSPEPPADRAPTAPATSASATSGRTVPPAAVRSSCPPSLDQRITFG